MIMGTVLERERGTPSHPSAKEMEGSQITVTLGPTEAPPRAASAAATGCMLRCEPLLPDEALGWEENVSPQYPWQLRALVNVFVPVAKV